MVNTICHHVRECAVGTNVVLGTVFGFKKFCVYLTMDTVSKFNIPSICNQCDSAYGNLNVSGKPYQISVVGFERSKNCDFVVFRSDLFVVSRSGHPCDAW